MSFHAYTESVLLITCPGTKTVLLNCFSKSLANLKLLPADYKMQKLPTYVPPQLTLRARRIVPDNLLLLSVAKACVALGDVRNAKELHDDAIRFGFHSDVSLGNAMIDMFGKCKYVDGARPVFDAMAVKDVVSLCVLVMLTAGCLDTVWRHFARWC
ncbi:hypothetical protein C1H46_000603 [Malus baccata]|uniref:Pentatricopeptide repeat-containing protein n=1 Tax=Malus baccata TaxID=106549 RepID=A0A540NRC4_MALBA|nr:hypothetical protein C1H46_000603 [Malus baccata]